MLAMLKGEQETTHNQDYVMGWELFGRRAIRKGDWKIVWEPAGIPWEPRETDVPVAEWRLYILRKIPENWKISQAISRKNWKSWCGVGNLCP